MARSDRNPLAFPVGAVPGFDPSHVASPSIKFSAISVAGGFINIVPGFASLMPSTINGTVGQTIDGVIGRGKTPGTTNNFVFTSGAAAQSVFNTMAAIIRTGASDNAGIFTNTGISASAQILSVFSGNLFFTDNNAGDVNSTIPLAANTPYFVVASKNGNASNYYFLALNLNTGVIATSVVNLGLAGVSGQSGYTIGEEYEFSTFYQGTIAAVMHAAAAMSPQQMLAWAADPWSFWYPDMDGAQFSPRVGVAAGDTLGGSMQVLMM